MGESTRQFVFLTQNRKVTTLETMEQWQGLTKAPVAVVMVPLPAQGHLNQLLHFSRLISARGVPVHYIGSFTHNRQAKQRIHGWDPDTTSNIHFHNFPLPLFPNPPPNPNAFNKFPAHFQSTFEASLHLREPLSALLHTLSTTTQRVAVVYDSIMAFAAQEARSISNCEAYAFHSISTFASLLYEWESSGKSTGMIPKELPYLPLEGCFTERFSNFISKQYKSTKYVDGHIYNTCRAIEGEFIDLLGQDGLLGNKRKWAVGPFNPVVIPTSNRHHKCLEWLDGKPRNSVVFISFGTMTSISDEQIIELAIGLERSEQNFIWVLRDADRGDIYANGIEARKIELPTDYEDRVKGRGIIVRDWAPQLEILAHPSTGGFLSHCGWNSCMESLSMGVPIAAWPMHSDQPRNTMLVTEVLKVGFVVRDWARRKEIVSRDKIENAVRKLMALEESNQMRRRAEELGVVVRLAVAENGTSTTGLDSFLSHISRQEIENFKIFTSAEVLPSGEQRHEQYSY